MLTAGSPPIPLRGCAWDVRLASDLGNAFDAVRLILATLVILEHSYFLIDGHSRRDPLSLLSRGQTNCGHFAVIMFFVLSGFLVTRSLVDSRSAPRYLLKRVARIVPGFLVASAFGCFVVGPLTAIGGWAFLRQQAWGTIAATALALKQVGVTGALLGIRLQLVNGTLWTIQYEFDCYLILALLGALGLIRSTAAGAAVYVCLAAALAAGFAAGLPVIDHGVAALLVSSPNQWPDLFPFFLAGSAFYLWRDRIPKSFALLWPALAVLSVSLFVGGAWWALLICGTYAILYICLSTSAELAIGDRRIDLSYGVYLYGWPIQQLLLFYLGQYLTPLSLFAAAVAVTYIVAWISWTLVEEPCLGLVRARRRLQTGSQAICA